MIQSLLLFFFAIYSDDIYIPRTTACLVHDEASEAADFVGGAAQNQGNYDITPSKYFTSIDAYNLKSCGSLHILPKFKTYQQTSYYSCGVASAIMAINYLNNADVACEKDLYIAMNTAAYRGTSPTKLRDGLNNRPEAAGKYVAVTNAEAADRDSAFEDDASVTGYQKFKDFVINAIDNNEILIVLSNNWGGHYEVIIGYDDLGNANEDDDVLIMADPYDTTDHFQEGYTIWSAWRFYAMWHMSTWTYYHDDDYTTSDPPYSSTYIKVSPATPKANTHTAACSIDISGSDRGYGLMRIATQNLILLFSLFFLVSAWL